MFVVGSRWRVKNLTYKISKYPSRLNRAEVDTELAKAFNVWADYTDLTFTQKRSGQVHIEIRYIHNNILNWLSRANMEFKTEPIDAF